MKFLKLLPLTDTLLLSAVELDQRSLGGLWTLEGYRRELESPNSDLLVLQSSQPPLQAEESADLLGLGCLWAILDEAHITILTIDPGYQRQGLGQVMLYALLVSAWQRKLAWATLEVRVSNQPAVSLYRKFGFQDVGRRRRYYQDTGEDALILWRKDLQQTEFQKILAEWQRQVGDRLHASGWAIDFGQWTVTSPESPESPESSIQ